MLRITMGVAHSAQQWGVQETEEEGGLRMSAPCLEANAVTSCGCGLVVGEHASQPERMDKRGREAAKREVMDFTHGVHLEEPPPKYANPSRK